MPTVLSNTALKGANNAFHMRFSAMPTIWQNHAMQITAATQTEPLVFPGFIPSPRQFLDGRSIQGIRDFRYNVDIQEFELSLLIARTTIEDDQTGTIMARMRDLAEVWATYKDYLFVQLLINGATAGSNGFDGATFYGSSRTIGSSGTIDNTSAGAYATAGFPTGTETLLAIQKATAVMDVFNNDQGQPFNVASRTRKRMVVPPAHDRGVAEAIGSTIIGNSDNPWGRGIVEYDSTPYLTATSKSYLNYVGSERKPFIYMERTPLELVFFNDEQSIAEKNGLLVLTRQRFVMTYGDPRMSNEITWV